VEGKGREGFFRTNKNTAATAMTGRGNFSVSEPEFPAAPIWARDILLTIMTIVCNTGTVFSIPGSGFGKFPIPVSNSPLLKRDKGRTRGF